MAEFLVALTVTLAEFAALGVGIWLVLRRRRARAAQNAPAASEMQAQAPEAGPESAAECAAAELTDEDRSAAPPRQAPPAPLADEEPATALDASITGALSEAEHKMESLLAEVDKTPVPAAPRTEKNRVSQDQIAKLLAQAQ
jgi:flagellar biosynthesis/type III secretory pathway M-ring protein FliF/YscJ